MDAIIAHLKQQVQADTFKPPVTFVMPPVGPMPTVKSLADKLCKAEKLQAVVNKLGSWASAAQDDPGCCKELKTVFLELLDLCEVPQDYHFDPKSYPKGEGGPPSPAGEPGITALDVLRTLNDTYPLGDMVYTIRENEGEGWEGRK